MVALANKHLWEFAPRKVQTLKQERNLSKLNPNPACKNEKSPDPAGPPGNSQCSESG